MTAASVDQKKTTTVSAPKPWNDVSDLNEELLFRAIHQYGFKSMFDLDKFDYKEFKTRIDKEGYMDYHYGRGCKFAMKGSIIKEPVLYDRDSQKPMKEVVELVRSGQFKPTITADPQQVAAAVAAIKRNLQKEDDIALGRICVSCHAVIRSAHYAPPNAVDSRRLCDGCYHVFDDLMIGTSLRVPRKLS